MDIIVKYAHHVTAAIAILAALINSVTRLNVITKRRFTFSCGFYVTEYFMTVAVILSLFSGIVKGKMVLASLFCALVLWIIIILSYKLRGLVFISVHGIRRSMHSRLQDYLSSCASHNNSDRTSMYIYGGDSKIPCNMIIFKRVPRKVIRSVLDDVNVFLREYSLGGTFTNLFSLLLNAAAVYIALSVIL
ncbi:MAG: hypothetical protein E7312_07080 [Clostridiales bacterium]|nr:hypothetical protein [Clostridiales bacterium]